MSNEEKLSLLEETLEMDSGSLSPETNLVDVAEYDSLAKLSLIVLCDEEFSKTLTGEQIQEFKTVQDILDYMV